jgi:lipopolysaccharide/colanic/teichoic acid biosynthesis glycosyltransferase
LKKTSVVVDAVGEGYQGAPPLKLVVPPSTAFRAYKEGAFAKRVFDFFVALLAIALLAPVFLIVSLAVVLTSRGPIVFKQGRMGQNGEIFQFYKFRTMFHRNDDSIHRAYSERLINGWNSKGSPDGKFKMTQDPRITPLGRFLRKSSLDELPQLFNVLMGDMSLVGPRPPIEYEVEHYQEWHKQRLEAKPGITGLWQVSGRSQVPFDEMVMLDVHYMEHWSFMLDLKILLRTVPVVLFGVGGY